MESIFDIRALNLCGGSLLQFLMHGIAGNFKEDNPQSLRALQMLFDIEDGLIESGRRKATSSSPPHREVLIRQPAPMLTRSGVLTLELLARGYDRLPLPRV